MGKIIIPGKIYFQRKVQCPAHYLIDPKEDIFLREPVLLLRNVSESAVKSYGVKKMRIKRDRFGRKMIDWKKLYQMKKEGKLIQPYISASYAIENVFDPLSQICQQCQGRCKRGKGVINETSIKRLNG